MVHSVYNFNDNFIDHPRSQVVYNFEGVCVWAEPAELKATLDLFAPPFQAKNSPLRIFFSS